MDDVRSLLVQLGLDYLISRFEEHKINNLSVVKSLEISDINELIPALGDRKKFISHVNNLNDTQNDVSMLQLFSFNFVEKQNLVNYH
ncbi:unnamed protein product [Callosobruchus maculatus]|uniref:SAM domain-containing protein n=1 Tax=Callosobruchus maculatus TaxID=64391 RepID=A0A653BR40_CALMS|nr:unnamed protein product [Callosobruchus maculatus]